MQSHGYVLYQATLLTAKDGLKPHQSIVIQNGRIQWVGDDDKLPLAYQNGFHIFENCLNKLITPGLIDCHTHLVYAGNRANEYQLKLQGQSYQAIAQKGGGILSTVAATREASFDALIQSSLPRIRAMMAQGVSTVEIKSGYGLDFETEIKMLKVAKTLGQLTGVRVVTTYLGAHARPQNAPQKSKHYIQYICEEVLPYIVSEKLADAVDIFCESVGFSIEEAQMLFSKAQDLGLKIKCHADQLSAMGASTLAAKFKALSCDHLEYLDEQGILAMKESKTVAVLLPGAYYFTGEHQKPPIELLRQHHIPMAIATDCNPGTSPTTALPLMMHMACRFFGLTFKEAWQGVTLHAAKALGLHHKIGDISAGRAADLIRWSSHTTYEDLCYEFGSTFSHELMINGLWVKI